MISEPEIRVGLITDGAPRLEEAGSGLTLVRNMVIGEGFHWRRTIEATVEGTVEMLDKPQGNIHAVNVTGLERYIESVIASEMNPKAPEEFLKAHAVISRSWAMRKIKRSDAYGGAPSRPEAPNLVSWEESDSHSGFDVCSDDHCQRYRGKPEESGGAATRAVEATRGEVITDRNGDIADARFHKCCGGRTELFSTCWADTDYHYLTPTDDPWCDLSDLSPRQRAEFLGTILPASDIATTDFHDWQAFADRREIRQRFERIYGFGIGDIVHLAIKSKGPSGRIKELEITGSERSVTIGKELKIRRLLAENCLYSSWFDIRETETGFFLNGHGWGHGAGLCQIGAARMALEGRGYREILDFYYHGTKTSKLYD